MPFKLVKFDELMHDLIEYPNLEESISKIIRDMELEFEYNSLGVFLKDDTGKRFRFKIGRNISHTFMKNTIFGYDDFLLQKMVKQKKQLEFKENDKVKFEQDYKHLIIQPLFFKNEIMGFIFIDKLESLFDVSDKIKMDMFGSLISMIIKIANQEDKLERLRKIDPLTKLYNQRFFLEKSEELINQMRRYSRDLTVAMLKIDKFNDLVRRIGSNKTKKMMIQLADVLKNNVRNTEILGKISHDTIISVFPETSIGEAKVVAERLNEQISDIESKNECVIRWGIAQLHDGVKNIENLIKLAEEATYEASRKDLKISIYDNN